MQGTKMFALSAQAVGVRSLLECARIQYRNGIQSDAVTVVRIEPIEIQRGELGARQRPRIHGALNTLEGRLFELECLGMRRADDEQRGPCRDGGVRSSRRKHHVSRQSGCVLQRNEPPKPRDIGKSTYSTLTPCFSIWSPMPRNSGSVT